RECQPPSERYRRWPRERLAIGGAYVGASDHVPRGVSPTIRPVIRPQSCVYVPTTSAPTWASCIVPYAAGHVPCHGDAADSGAHSVTTRLTHDCTHRGEPTDDWQQLHLLTQFPAQLTYEVIRPVLLFGHSPAERAQQSAATARILYRPTATPVTQSGTT